MNLKIVLAVLHVVLGAVLIGLSQGITNDNQSAQLSDKLVKANQGLYTVGIVLVTLGVAVGLLGDALDQVQAHPMTNNIVLGLVAVLGITIVSLAGVILSEASGQTKTYAGLAVAIGAVLIVAVIGVVVMDVRKRHQSTSNNNVAFSMSDSSMSDSSMSDSSSDLAFRCY